MVDEITEPMQESLPKETKKKDYLKWIILLLALGCLVAFYFLYNYAQSESLKCLSDPINYAMNHSALITP